MFLDGLINLKEWKKRWSTRIQKCEWFHIWNIWL